VLAQHVRQLDAKRIREREDGAHRRRTLAAREGREKTEWRECDLFLPEEMRIQYRGERACCDPHLTWRLRRSHDRLMDLLVFGANGCRDLEKALHRSCGAGRMLRRQPRHEGNDRERTDDCAAM
jgi:hypothetical protein